MGWIKVRLSRESKRDIESRLRRLKKIPKAVIGAAANDAAKVMRTRVSTIVRDRIKIKKSDLDSKLKIERADEGRVYAIVRISHSERLPLKYFSPVATRAKKAAGWNKLKHLKRGRPTKAMQRSLVKRMRGYQQRQRKLAQGGVKYRITPSGVKFIEGAFIGPGKRLNQHVYIRTKRDTDPRAKLPIRKLWGVSVWGVLVTGKLVAGLRIEAMRQMEKAMYRRLRFELVKVERKAG